MDSHPDQAELKPATSTLEFDETVEDDLLEMINSLEARLMDVRDLHREQQDLEDELDDLNADLDARSAELDEREQLLGDSTTEMDSEREAIEEARAALAAQQAELERRRAELEAKEAEVGERFSNVDEMQAKLEAAESALRRERENREAEAERFRHEQAELAERERELQAKVKEQGEQTPEIMELAAQLAEAQKLANQRAEEAERRAGEAQQRTLELETRCKELAGECDVVRKELKGSREEVRRVEQQLPQQLYKRQVKAQRVAQAQRSIVTALTWLCVIVTMGAAGLTGLNGVTDDALILLGLSFAAVFAGSQTIAGKLFDVPGLVIGAIGASFGWWFPLWSAALGEALATWSIPTGGLPEAVAAQLPLGIAVSTAALTVTVGLFALTWSGSLLLQSAFVSLLAGGLAMFPDESGFALAAAGLLWIAVTGVGLTRWAGRTAGEVGLATKPAPAGGESGPSAVRPF